jgi:CubicO group peptidase (beta-lactamase class C family)
MMRMRSYSLGVLIVLSGCSSVGERPAAAAGWTAVDSARVQAIIAPLVAAHEFMGAVAFVRNGEVVHAQGAGMADVAAGRAFARATPADGGSLAKTLTAAAVWTLVHEKRIAIDTPVTTYVAEYPYAGTTVRQLIAHTNGLPPYYEAFDPYFGPRDVRTTAALLAVVRRAMPQPRFAPGTRFEYSNLGFDAAALVVERVTGQSIGTFFRSRFFAPIGMDSAFARPGRLADFPGPRTMGYRWADTAWVVADVFDNEAFIGGSNVYFSVLDLARWAGAHARGTALPRAVQTLGQSRPVIDGHPSPINGLSWNCDDSGDRCQYTGDNTAFHSLAYWDRARGGAVAMVSNSSLAPWTLITLQRDLVAALEGREPDRRPRPAFVNLTTDARAGVAGRYAAPGADTITVTDSKTGLLLRVGSGLVFDIFQVAPAEFYVPGLDQFLGFTGDPDARRMHVRSMFVDFVAPRVP